MKKATLTILTTWICLALTAVPVSAQEVVPKFNLKLSGGYGKIVGGDLPQVIDEINQLVKDMANHTGANVTSTLENAEWGPEFEFECVYNFNQKFGLSLGLGYICRKNDTSAALALDSLMNASLTMEYSSRAIPILLSGYYYLPLGSRTKTYFKAGVGYYFGKLNSLLREEAMQDGIADWEENEAEATDSALGIHGGIGFDFKLTKTLSLFAEAAGRYIKLNNWEGKNTYSAEWGSGTERGYFWYTEEYNHETGKHYANLIMLPHEPTWAEYRNTRKAEFNFSGFALKLGVMIAF